MAQKVATLCHSVPTLVTLLPTGKHGRKRTLRLTLKDGDVIQQVLDIPLRNQGATFTIPDARQEIDQFIGRRADSVLSRELARASDGAMKPVTVLERLVEMLRQQYAPEETHLEIDRGVRRQALVVLEEQAALARARLSKADR